LDDLLSAVVVIVVAAADFLWYCFATLYSKKAHTAIFNYFKPGFSSKLVESTYHP
jgi:hypothetical protein